MAIEFQCQSCQTIYRAKDEFLGRSTRCKQCGATVVIEPMSRGGSVDPVSTPKPAPKLALTKSAETVAPYRDPNQTIESVFASRRSYSVRGPYTKTGLAICVIGGLLPLIAVAVGHIHGAEDVATTLAYVGVFLVFVGGGLCAVEKQWVPAGVGAGLGILAFGIALGFIPAPSDSGSSATAGNTASTPVTPVTSTPGWSSTPVTAAPTSNAPSAPAQVLSSSDTLAHALPTTRPFTAETESVDRLESPVRFNEFAIRPPRKAPVMLQDFTPPPIRQIRWQVTSEATVSIRFIDKDLSQMTQKRVLPVVSSAEEGPNSKGPNGVISVAGKGQAFESTGTIAGLTFQRIVFGESPRNFSSGYYAADLGPRFLIVGIQGPANDSELSLVLDQFARSLHKPQADEVVVDPFDNDTVTARLEGKEVDEVLKVMAARGKGSEPVLLRQLDKAPLPMKIKLIDTLAKVGTEESIPQLVRYAASPNPALRAVARRTGAAIRPSQFNDFSLSIMDLQCGEDKAIERGLSYLAHMEPNDRRDEIALLLEKVYRNSIFRKDVLTDAIWRWHNDRLIYMLIDDISSGDTPDFNIETAFTILPRTQDPDAARAIARWLNRRPQRAIDALVEFGPVAEPIAIDLLTDPAAPIRESAVQILRSIGTEQCLEPLTKLEKRSSGGMKDMVKETIEAIQDRLGIQPTTAPTTKGSR